MGLRQEGKGEEEKYMQVEQGSGRPKQKRNFWKLTVCLYALKGNL